MAEGGVTAIFGQITFGGTSKDAEDSSHDILHRNEVLHTKCITSDKNQGPYPSFESHETCHEKHRKHGPGGTVNKGGDDEQDGSKAKIAVRNDFIPLLRGNLFAIFLEFQ